MNGSAKIEKSHDCLLWIKIIEGVDIYLVIPHLAIHHYSWGWLGKTFLVHVLKFSLLMICQLGACISWYEYLNFPATNWLVSLSTAQLFLISVLLLPLMTAFVSSIIINIRIFLENIHKNLFSNLSLILSFCWGIDGVSIVSGHVISRFK